MSVRFAAAIALTVLAVQSAGGQQPLYLNPDADPVARARDLVSRMTVDEKVPQLMNAAPAIPRLGVPA